FDSPQDLSLRTSQSSRDFRIQSQNDLITFATVRSCQASRFFEDFVTDSLRRLKQSRTLTNLAWRAQSTLERLLHALASHDYEAEIVERKYLCRRLVVSECVLQSRHHSLPVAALFHVDQIEHDDATQIAKPDLPDDFFYS